MAAYPMLSSNVQIVVLTLIFLSGTVSPVQIQRASEFGGAQENDVFKVRRRESKIENDLQQIVWVTGYPRSGSSTMLSMVSAAGYTRPDIRVPGQTFSLFEPCHNGDALDESLTAEGCRGLLTSISRCDFSRVRKLWGWAEPHTTNDHKSYSKELATRYCSCSDVVAFKTVDYGHNLVEHLDWFDAEPRMKVVSIVRDPRSILASWKTTEPFATLVSQGGFYNLSQICESFASNLDVKHEHVYHIDFDEATRRPHDTMKKLYEFLNLPYGDAQEAWINKTFDATDCPPSPPNLRGFQDCHQKSDTDSEKWRRVLTAEELELYDNSPACQRVAQAYNYAL